MQTPLQPANSPVSSTRPYTHADWQRGYDSQRQESAYWIENIEGHIPIELHGTLFRNGPGLLDIGGRQIHHPFDGDGMVCAIAFSQGRAHFQNRFVRTTGFVAEQKAQTILYRGVFGTQKPGGWLANCFDLRLKNIANTHVIYWGEKLLALWEAAEPHCLDPRTLETLGLDYLDGVLQPGDAFAAHPSIDPNCPQAGGAPRLVNFAVKPGLSTEITVYELNQGGKLVRQHTHAVPGFAFIHDFAITPNYCIFFQNPVQFNPLPYVLGLRGAGECITLLKNRPTKVIVISRHEEAPVRILETRAGFVFHHANAFEQGNEIWIDSICYDSLPDVEPDSDFRQVEFEALAPGQLWRFHLNLGTNAVQRQCLDPRCVEFPTLHPAHVGRSYRYLYLGAAHAPEGNAPLQALLKLDLQTGRQQFWSAAPRAFLGEPVFVPRPLATDEDDGWLLAMVYDAAHHRSDVVILEAKNLAHGPIARLHLRYHIPYGLHGSFLPEWFGPKHT